jgi:phosphotransferase system enzyme I (PtsI)
MSTDEGDRTNLTLQGTGVSPGIALGAVYLYHDSREIADRIRTIEAGQVEDEYARVEEAFREVQEDLEKSEHVVQEELDSEFARIFRSHQMVLQDPELLREIRERLERERINAEAVIRAVFQRLEAKLRAAENEQQRDSSEDIADLARRVLHSLTGSDPAALQDFPAGAVLIARRLLPSDTLALPQKKIAGIVVEEGGPASHAAILTRELGIPAVCRLAGVTRRARPDESVLVDGSTGTVILNPDEEVRESYRKQQEQRIARMAEVRERAHETARSVDGEHVRVMANVGKREHTVLAAENGADGVGLYRIEDLYLSRTDMPDEDEVYEHVRSTLEPMAELSATVRLLDIGADKDVPNLNMPSERDPRLGRRGVRLLLAYPKLLRTQLRALLRLSAERELRILVPMVTLPDDVKLVREVLEEEARELGLDEVPPLGTMIETPAAALGAAGLARHCEFFSVGTNDLTQYTMAAGRENRHVEGYYLEEHPAVFELIRTAAAGAASLELEVCGELASRQTAVGPLLRAGVRCLSVAPMMVGPVKDAVREAAARTTDEGPW